MVDSSREAFEKWKDALPECSETCDGDLVGTEHDKDCPLYPKGFATHRDAFEAGWQASRSAAIEECAAVMEKAWRKGFTWEETRDEILLLKGEG